MPWCVVTRGTWGLGLDCVCSAAVGHSLEASARAGEEFMSRAPASHWLSALPSCELIGGETRGAARRAESGHDITSTTTIFVDINGSLIRTWADDRVVQIRYCFPFLVTEHRSHDPPAWPVQCYVEMNKEEKSKNSTLFYACWLAVTV